MLLVSSSFHLWKITQTPNVHTIELSFPPFSIFSFLLQFPIPPLVSQIIKKPCSSYSFRFRHLSFSDLMKKTISSQIMSSSVGFLRRILFRSALFYTFKNLFISYFLQHHILKLSKYLIFLVSRSLEITIFYSYIVQEVCHENYTI